MNWRVVLVVVVSVAVLLGALGVVAITFDIQGPFGRECVFSESGNKADDFFCEPEARSFESGLTEKRFTTGPLSESIALWWFLAAGAVLLIGLASIPLLRQRESKGR